MFKGPTKFGFAAPAHDHARHESPLPALIASIALVLSIAVVLTAITVNAARAAHLF